jgi:hypothetical protein
MKKRIQLKKSKINLSKKPNIGGQTSLFAIENREYSENASAFERSGESALAREALSLARASARPEVFSIKRGREAVAEREQSLARALAESSRARELTRKEVIQHFEKNALSGARDWSWREATQRKIIKATHEKELKIERLKILKEFKQKRIAPLEPYYQIQTCFNDNSHFARLMVLCSCNDHINCGVCRLKRIRRIQKKYLPVLSEFKNAKMLTLTFKRIGSLENTLEKFKIALGKIKRTKDWKNKVDLYFGSIEVVENNVHAHIIVDSKFWAQADISDLWLKVSGNPIVDIRKVKNPEKAIKEVFKYIVKDMKKDLLEEVSELRKKNSHLRWIFSSKGLAKLVDSGESDCEAIDEAEILSALEGEAESATSLDTIAISRTKVCPCCASNLVLVGDFETKDQAEAEIRRILAGNQYRNNKRQIQTQ